MIVDKSLQRIILLLVSLAAFLIPFMGSSLSLALPVISQDLQVNIVLLGWIPTAFLLANAAFVLPFGRLADIYGRRKVFALGVFIYTLASFLAAFSSTGELLIIFSFLQGLGCAMIFATMVALLSSVFPMDQRGSALGLYVTSVFIGLFMGPILGGFLIENLGWRSIFLFNVPLGIFLLIILFWKLHIEWAESRGEHFDIKGTIIYSLSLLAILYGISSFFDLSGMIILTLGILGLMGFFLLEKDTQSPMLSLEIFKNRLSSFSALSMLLLNMAISGMATFLSLYFQSLRGFNPQTTALILACQPLMVALLSPLVGRIVDWKNYPSLPVLGLVLITIGLGMLVFLGGESSLLLPVLALIMVGIGQALFSSPITKTYMGSVPRKIYGTASSLFSTVIYLGQSLSLAILIIIFNLYLGRMEINPSNFPLFLDGLKTAFIIYTIISCAALLSTIISSRDKNSFKEKNI
jgi:EmrB/QacA subfamily drug resistance transporter